MGIAGVTHMMMLDVKNLQIADVILNWVNRNVARVVSKTEVTTRQAAPAAVGASR